MSDQAQIRAKVPTRAKVPSFCALCVSRCGAIATVEDGRLIALSADSAHPTGQALCIKGKVAPELVYHPDRLEYPMQRTQPKGALDPDGNGSVGTKPSAQSRTRLIVLLETTVPRRSPSTPRLLQPQRCPIPLNGSGDCDAPLAARTSRSQWNSADGGDIWPISPPMGQHCRRE